MKSLLVGFGATIGLFSALMIWRNKTYYVESYRHEDEGWGLGI